MVRRGSTVRVRQRASLVRVVEHASLQRLPAGPTLVATEGGDQLP
jgi:hypothetical protein